MHFDAKYRAENINKVFGEAEVSDETIEAEKLENKAERTYKRGDLLKMHTYNDALRHTIGSYVLYPGTNTSEALPLIKFHEIAPGVGAMVMKPGSDECLNRIKGFLKDVFQHQSDMFSQYRYLSDASYQTYSDKPEIVEESGSTYNIARKDAPCVLVYVKKSQAEEFKDYGFAYCQVSTKDTKKPLNIDLSLEVGSEFIPYGGSRSAPKKSLGWRAKISSIRLIEIGELQKLIQRNYPNAKIRPQSAEHYLLYEFTDIASFPIRDVSELHANRQSISKYMAITCNWNDILNP